MAEHNSIVPSIQTSRSDHNEAKGRGSLVWHLETHRTNRYPIPIGKNPFWVNTEHPQHQVDQKSAQTEKEMTIGRHYEKRTPRIPNQRGNKPTS